MSLRRVQMLNNTEYLQSLRLNFNAPLVVVNNNLICIKRDFEKKEIQVQIAAQYSQNGDNINLIAYLQKSSPFTIKASSCVFTISELVGDGTWNVIQTDVINGSENSEFKWTATISASSVISNVCMGKSTLKIQAKIIKINKSYANEIFINHLGLAEAAHWMRNKLNYLEAIKKDE